MFERGTGITAGGPIVNSWNHTKFMRSRAREDTKSHGWTARKHRAIRGLNFRLMLEGEGQQRAVAR